MSITLESQPVRVLFAKDGGTWDMEVDSQGKLKGVGNLGDAEIHDLMYRRRLLEPLTKNERMAGEREFAVYLYERFKTTQPLDIPVERYFAPWCPEFGNYAVGEFYPFFSGDSSHLTHPFVAAMIVNHIERRIEDPTRILVGAEGTDAADVAFLNQDDVLTFDTDLPPEYYTGANQSRHETNSDAPANFLRLAKLASLDPRIYLPDPRYPSGAFWSFHKFLYSGADVAKFDPKEERLFEGQDTFFSANSYAHLDNDQLTLFRVDQDGDGAIRRKRILSYHYAHK